MIRNTALKKALTNCVFPAVSFLNGLVPKDDRQVFIYCANDTLSDNSEALFDYMIANGYNKKYHIVCGVKDPEVYKSRITDNVSFIPKSKCVQQYVKSAYVFYSFGKLPIKPAKDQCVINLWHGIPLKTIGKLANIDNGEEFFFSYVCASSEMYRPIMAKAFGCPEENVCICGEPKMDRLFEKKMEGTEKLIVWTPTFRQSKYLGYDDSADKALLPLFQQEEWTELNQILADSHVHMVVKLHPLQDVGEFTQCEMSNLSVYSGEHFTELGRNLYSLLAQSDALISDYSSVYLEYLVLDRPICFAVGDMEEYSGKRGFVFDDPLEFMPGDQIQDKHGMYQFIHDISAGIDRYQEKRKAVNKRVNYFKDGKNCKRILEIAGITLNT